MVTLVSSLYKSEKYLKSFLNNAEKVVNLINQQGIDCELILIANEPSYEELQIIKPVLSNSHFRLIEVPREPLYATWNRGVREAKGDVVGFWNVDDTRNAKAVVESVELFKNGADLVYFPFLIKKYFTWKFLDFPIAFRFIGPSKLQYNQKVFETGMLCGPHFMFTKEAYNKVGPFDEQFKIAGDFDWCTRAAKIGLKFMLAKSLSGSFRVDGGGLSAGASSRQIVENNLVYKRNGADNKIIPQDEELAKSYREDELLSRGEYIQLAK